MSCISISVYSVLVSLPVSISISISFSVPLSVSISVPIPIPLFVSISVSIPVPAMVMVIAVVILYRVVITVGGPCWIMMSALTVSLVVLTVIVFPDMWLAVAVLMVTVTVVVVVIVVVAIMLLVIISSLRLVSLRCFAHLSIPLHMQVPVAEPLTRVPTALGFLTTGCMIVLRLAVMLRPAVIVMVVMVMVGVLRSLWFSSQEQLFFFSLALFVPLVLCWR